MVEAIVEHLMFVGVAVTWVMSTATLAVSAVTLYLFSQCQREKRQESK